MGYRNNKSRNNKKFQNSPLCISGFAVIKIFAIIITIVAVIISIILSVRFASAKFRDIKRNSDITGLQKALDIYSDTSGKFPIAKIPICLNGNDAVNKELIGKKYLLRSVYDPKFPDKNPSIWPPSENQSCYYYESDGTRYFVGYCLEGLLESSAECKYIRK